MSRPSVTDGPEVADLAAAMFGDALPSAERYAELLRSDGVEHGHLGPRETERLWERHLLNCAVLADLVPAGAGVVDVGSGAGLPGLPVAIRRPDLRVTLVEPMQRRVDFLDRCVREVGLEQRVTVVRGRAGDDLTARTVGPCQWVTARAVAPLDRLVRWCETLMADDGALLAMKGERAPAEAEEHRAALRRMGMAVRSIEELAVGDAVTRVVVVGRQAPGKREPARRGGR